MLSTIHSAKGLEWEAVHVLALYDGNFPACMSAGTEREHRRGAPAALRRDDPRAAARCTLYVPVRYYHRPRGRDDAHGYGKPSRFLTDEVQQLCEIVRPAEESLGVTGTAPRRRITVSVDSLFE